jgi:hypothetical protein
VPLNAIIQEVRAGWGAYRINDRWPDVLRVVAAENSTLVMTP